MLGGVGQLLTRPALDLGGDLSLEVDGVLRRVDEPIQLLGRPLWPDGGEQVGDVLVVLPP